MSQLRSVQKFQAPKGFAENTDANLNNGKKSQQCVMDDFFGMHKDLGIDSVEEELRLIRQGRRRLLDDL